MARAPRSLLLLGLLVAGGVALAGLAEARRDLASPGRHGRRLLVDGRARDYWLHVPRAYDGQTPLPLLLALHWAEGDARAMEFATGLSELAEREGIIVAYPEGTGRPQVWNAGYCCGDAAARGVDDVGFVRALLAELRGRLAIDPDRVYLVGLSNGGMLAHRAGAELADEVAGIAAVAASLGGRPGPGEPLMVPPAPSRPVTAYIIHGRRDERLPYDGGPSAVTGGERDHLAVVDAVDFWRRAAGCGDVPLRTELGDGAIVREEYGPCDEAIAVRLDSFLELGHEWPGARYGLRRRPPPHGYVTADEIWAFFAALPRRSPAAGAP